MNDQEKIKAAIDMLKKLQRMVGFFMKKEVSELINKLEDQDQTLIRSQKKEVHT